jgi:hypothetical protein
MRYFCALVVWVSFCGLSQAQYRMVYPGYQPCYYPVYYYPVCYQPVYYQSEYSRGYRPNDGLEGTLANINSTLTRMNSTLGRMEGTLQRIEVTLDDFNRMTARNLQATEELRRYLSNTQK